jgi:cyclopropane-fatty-acyl-phospholipid synthase
MTQSIVHQKIGQYYAKHSGFCDRIARQMLHKRLNSLLHGTITLSDGSGSLVFGTRLAQGELSAHITVLDQRFYRNIVFGGSIGSAEAYMAGFWQCDDLVSLIRIILQNSEILLDIERGLAWLSKPLHRLFHDRRKNTRKGSAANIRAHYDIGNDLYSLFLDETMMYSCGIFERQDTAMHEASIIKNDHICRKLKLGPEDHLIEIGSGWGGFAIYAAEHYGCMVTTTTISQEQYDFVRERIIRAGLSDRVILLLEDYRELNKIYDKLVSIEMIEAVGHEFLPTFFQCCGRLLKKDGLMAMQAITIADQAYNSYIRSVDFIRRYIFPGGSITSVTALCTAATSASDLRLVHLEDITPHYAQTLREWRNRFVGKIDAVRSLDYPEQFIRMWIYYLCYCEAGFIERYIGDVQMLFAKPGWRGDTLFAC